MVQLLDYVQLYWASTLHILPIDLCIVNNRYVQARCDIDTLSLSIRFVTITMVGGCSCQMSLQKSFNVPSVGPLSVFSN